MRWSIDFVADTLAAGRRFRILTMVDDFIRECIGLVTDTSFTGLRSAERALVGASNQTRLGLREPDAPGNSSGPTGRRPIVLLWPVSVTSADPHCQLLSPSIRTWDGIIRNPADYLGVITGPVPSGETR